MALAGTQPQILQYALTRRADVAQLHAGAQLLQLARKPRHERFRKRRVVSQRFRHFFLRIDPHPRRRCRDGIAVVGVGKQSRFGKELAAARRMKDDEMVVDGTADQAKPPAFHLVDRASARRQSANRPQKPPRG